MVTNRQVWLEKKVGREEFHRVPSVEAAQWVPCREVGETLRALTAWRFTLRTGFLKNLRDL